MIGINTRITKWVLNNDLLECSKEWFSQEPQDGIVYYGTVFRRSAKTDNRKRRQSSFPFLISFERFGTSLPHQVYSLCVVWLWWVLDCDRGEMVGNEFCTASRRALKGCDEIKDQGSFHQNVSAPPITTPDLRTYLVFPHQHRGCEMWCSSSSAIQMFRLIIHERCYSFPLVSIHIYLYWQFTSKFPRHCV